MSHCIFMQVTVLCSNSSLLHSSVNLNSIDSMTRLTSHVNYYDLVIESHISYMGKKASPFLIIFSLFLFAIAKLNL